MKPYRIHRDEEGQPYVETVLRGPELLQHPLYSKGSAFTVDERRHFDLEGLLPPTPSTEAQQLARTYASIVRKTDEQLLIVGAHVEADGDLVSSLHGGETDVLLERCGSRATWPYGPSERRW